METVFIFKDTIIAIFIISFIIGIIGSIVVLKNISSIGGSISHAILGSIGLANFLNLNPYLINIPSAVFIGLIFFYIKIILNNKDEHITSIIWSLGAALGIILLYLSKNKSLAISTYLFGNILLINSFDNLINFILLVLLLIFLILFSEELKITMLDEEYAKTLNLNTNLINLLSYILVSLSVVVLVKSLGIILLITLLSIPSLIAMKFSYNFYKLILISIIISLISLILGFLLSFKFDLPLSSIITLILITLFFIISYISIKKDINN
ncbi:MAG: iron chelate uptake ABC transporter family permease subunit [bacterium]|jgi:zinc transport system permease protein